MNVLVLCTGNACRSQMAEGWFRHLGRGAVAARSAGIEAHGRNPRAIDVMAEAGVDIGDQQSSTVTNDDLAWADVVITVCGHADEHCPLLPPRVRRVHWPLADPARAHGTESEIMDRFRRTRDEIRSRVQAFLSDAGAATNEREGA